MNRVFLIVVLFCTAVFPQTYMDTLNFFSTRTSPNLLITNLEKQLNTYYLNSAINYENEFGKFSLGFHENYHSTFIKTEDKNIRDEHSFLLNTGYNPDSLWGLKLSVSNIILSDNRRIDINQASVSNAVLLGRISPISRISISPFGGYSNNRQKQENDYGPVYGIGGIIDRLNFTDLTISSEMLFRNEDISPRKNFNRLINLNALNIFSGDIENNLNLRFSESRKDFYYDADSVTSSRFSIRNNIQSRTESNYQMQDNMFYNDFLGFLSLDLTGRILWRNIERNTRYKIAAGPSNTVFDTDIDELRMEVESGFSFSSPVHRTSLRMILSQRDEKHILQSNPESTVSLFEERSDIEKRKNNNSERASLMLTSDIDLSFKDKLRVSFLQNKLRYDTPSEQNFDDRDETLSIGRIRYSRLMTPFFEFFMALEGTYSHIVYIFSEQSSNNYINRIIKLNTGGIYRGKNIVSSNSFDVSANYTVYDFEDLNPNYRSFSFRQFTASDSSVINLGRSLNFSFNGYIKLSEQGDLRWKSFKTRPNRYLEEMYFEPEMILVSEYLHVSAGIRIFSLKSFLYKDNIRQLNTSYLSRGPVTELVYRVSNVVISRFFCWYEFIKMEDNGKKEQLNLTLQAEWNF